MLSFFWAESAFFLTPHTRNIKIKPINPMIYRGIIYPIGVECGNSQIPSAKIHINTIGKQAFPNVLNPSNPIFLAVASSSAISFSSCAISELSVGGLCRSGSIGSSVSPLPISY
jgi:hypothetical protein